MPAFFAALDFLLTCLVSRVILDTGDLPPGTLQKWTEFYNEVARQKKKEIKIIGLHNKKEAEEEIKNQ